MESVVDDDSPLAQYLLEGEGQVLSSTAVESPETAWQGPRRQYITSSYATSNGQTGLPQRIRTRVQQPLRIQVPRGSQVAKIHTACSQVVNTKLTPADNGRFLEHFRYTIVASQLLSEQTGYSGAASSSHFKPKLNTDDYRNIASTTTGAFVTATTAFAAVWLMHWAKLGRTDNLSRSRVAAAATCLILVGTVLYSYVKRKWLQYQRQLALDAAQLFITNVQSLNSQITAALTFIQEVELVSRGYRISSPLPPITRLEEKGQARRCARLRKSLSSAFAACIPPFLEACDALRIISPQDDFEKYLDVYEVNDQDLVEAHFGYDPEEFSDKDSLKTLRILQLRLSVLRREFLCSLLSLEADGTQDDLERWRHAAERMRTLALVSGDYSDRIHNILNEQELFVTTPSKKRMSVTPAASSMNIHVNPEVEKIRNQVRKLGGLSSGIRGLQAKLQILREESEKSLDETETDLDVPALGGSLVTQYDSVGADLRALLRDWEAGKASLMANLERNERRISQLSAGSSNSGELRSPATSLGGLTLVEESPLLGGGLSGTPSDALRALNGETPVNMKRLSLLYGPSLNHQLHSATNSNANSLPGSSSTSPLLGNVSRLSLAPTSSYNKSDIPLFTTTTCDTPPLTTATTLSASSLAPGFGFPFPRPTTPIGSSDEEIFEAIAIPRPRSKRFSNSSFSSSHVQNMSREEKLKMMRAENQAREAAAAAVKERREAGFNLVKELEGVLGSRKRELINQTKRDGARVTSFCL